MFSDNLTEVLKANNLLECCSLPADIYFPCQSATVPIQQNQINTQCGFSPYIGVLKWVSPGILNSILLDDFPM